MRPALPRLADGTELLGEYEDSGLKENPYLARRADGQVVQLPRLLYLVAEEADGQRDFAEIAERVSETFGRRVSTDNVRVVVEEKLRPMGVLEPADGAAPKLKRADPMLALTVRSAVVPERIVRTVGRILSPLFFPPVVLAVLGALVALDVWLFFFHGIAQPTRELIYQPALVLMVLGLVVLSAVFHECGHAAAARYGGAEPGVMGAGIYLIWPVLYTDVTDAYRLGRGGRLRTDLGGIYFNFIFALATAAAFFATGFEPLLVVVLVQHIQVLYQLLPFLRLDGHYIVSDLTGVPDIMSRVKPTLQSLLPWRTTDDRVRELKPWARVSVTAYALLLVPLFGLVLVLMGINAPRIFATAWDSFFVHYDRASGAFGGGSALTGLTGMVHMSSLVLPAIGLTLAGGRIGRRAATSAWAWSEGSPPRRAGVMAAGAAVIGTVVFLWWPNGQYRPIQPDERGTITGGVHQLAYVPSGRPALTEERATELRGAPGYEEIADGGDEGDVRIIERSREKSNLAVAINQRDGASIFALAFSITSVMNGVVDQTNAAVAIGNCRNCRTVAIAIQIVLVMSDPIIIAPTNTATAVNYACKLCVTFAAAYQLIFGAGEAVGFTDEGQQLLAGVRERLLALKEGDITLDELQAELTGIVETLEYILENELVPLEEAAPATDDTTEETETVTTETATTETSTTETSTTETSTTETTP